MLATAVTSLISLSGGLQKGIQYDCTHTHTNISCCALLNSVSHSSSFVLCVCVIRLCKLYHLNLSYCERLTDAALEWLSGSSVCSLDISGCDIQDQVLFTCYTFFLKKRLLAFMVSSL